MSSTMTNGITKTRESVTTEYKLENTTQVQGNQTNSASVENEIISNGSTSIDVTTPSPNYNNTDYIPEKENIPALPTELPTTHSASTTLHSTNNRKGEEQSSSGGLIAFFVIIFVILIIISLIFVLKKKKKMSYSFDRTNKSPESSGIPLDNIKA
ncbi:hypothetical protein XENTR_v10000749 [Xenopus tropicalis]|nr:hypothetical protein XENTR_v10000749 [Xenopus tropicalis]